MNEYLSIWEEIGKDNHWISQAYDPPFERDMLIECQSAEELAEKLVRGNYCLGQGFYWLDQCWINQIDGGDEWMVIKQDARFESVTARRVAGANWHNDHKPVAVDRLIELINVFDRTPIEVLVKLEYDFDFKK